MGEPMTQHDSQARRGRQLEHAPFEVCEYPFIDLSREAG